MVLSLRPIAVLVAASISVAAAVVVSFSHCARASERSDEPAGEPAGKVAVEAASEGTPGSQPAAAVKAPSESSSTGVELLQAKVLARYPHAVDAFTQGLIWHAGSLYETTGLHGQSRLRRLNLDSGEVELEYDLSDDLFGEGLARVGDSLVWLTWKAGRALRFGVERFEPLGEWTYSGEGWGLCEWQGSFFRSDGTATVSRHDTESFALLGSYEVTLEGTPIRWLNELECTSQGILANVWQRDQIMRFDPRSGKVTAVIDASGLLNPEERPHGAVLNGIAYRPQTDTYLVTGKLWPAIFEVVFEKTGES